MKWPPNKYSYHPLPYKITIFFLFLLIIRTFRIYSLGNFQVHYNITDYNHHAAHYISMIIIIGSLYLLTLPSLIYSPPSNHHSVLCNITYMWAFFFFYMLSQSLSTYSLHISCVLSLPLNYKLLDSKNILCHF